jgi:hypothetical protein
MTKEELYGELFDYKTEHKVDSADIDHLLNKFFESNICIPKGTNRHPYADVLHEAIENGNLQKRYKYSTKQGIKSKWFDFIIDEDDEYRVKPIYEWQYVIIYNGEATLTSEYYTAEEFWDIHSSLDSIDAAYQLEESKRIRK